MARMRVILFNTGFFPNDHGLDFLRVETNLDHSPPVVGFVKYEINGVPGQSRVRLDFFGYFYPSDLTAMVNSGALTGEQRYVFERVAPEIINFYHKMVGEQVARMEQMAKLIMQSNDINRQLEELVLKEERAMIHEEDQ